MYGTSPDNVAWFQSYLKEQRQFVKIGNIEKWSVENKMYINTEKTKVLLVTGKRLQHKLSEETTSLRLCFDGSNIDQLSFIIGFDH